MNKLVNGVVVPLTSDELKDLETRKAAAPSETEIKWLQVRNKRNRLLLDTDWVVTKASDTGVALSDEWKIYRQELRDLPATQTDVDNITYPTKPN